MGLYAMAGVLQWHLETRLNLGSAAGLLLSAALLMWAPFPIYLHLIGAAILVAIVVMQNKESSAAVLAK
jgi:endonuclease/exonuclease/phosphatase (EEP) superfamily protein YafD